VESMSFQTQQKEMERATSISTIATIVAM
jgi:hypothetical protein